MYIIILRVGAMCFMLVLILDMQPLCLKDQSKFIDNVMINFPHYALGSGMKNIYSSYEYNEICDFQKNSKSDTKHIIYYYHRYLSFVRVKM